MGRWAPDAHGRLGEAAMALFLEHGYEQTTVTDIAERAGLTARTFFRYYTDKREVLFDGADALLTVLTDTLAAAPKGSAPLEAVSLALGEVATRIGTDREFSRQRQQVIDTHADLQERELVKLAGWSQVLTAGLRARGARAGDAAIAAETGVAVFRVAFARWLEASRNRALATVLRESFGRLQALAG